MIAGPLRTALAVSALRLGAPASAAWAGGACHAQVLRGVLPVWARGGFSEKPRLPHTLGGFRRIVAILFGYPLLSPPAASRNNKILWVSRTATRPLSDLRIDAQRMDGRRPVGPSVARTVRGGPGPSIIDLPAPGCWRLTLRWSGRSDTLDLDYANNR